MSNIYYHIDLDELHKEYLFAITDRIARVIIKSRKECNPNAQTHDKPNEVASDIKSNTESTCRNN